MFTIGERYKRIDLHKEYGGQQQGGISTPSKYPMILLFTGESGEQYGYADTWTDDGTFLYTGEGQVGDMEFVRGNKAVRDHVTSDRALHLFKYVSSGVVEYLGEMKCVGHFNEIRPSLDGHVRKAIVFELVPVKAQQIGATDSQEYVEALNHLALSALRQRAVESSADVRTSIERKALYRARSAAIKLYALKRADGECESCGQPAPFITRKGEPFLEVHHIRKLSDGGPDHPNAVAAICPNCHRRAHYSMDSEQFNKRLIMTIEEREGQLWG